MTLYRLKMTLLVILMIAATVLSYMFYDLGMMLSSFLVAIVAILQGVIIYIDK